MYEVNKERGLCAGNVKNTRRRERLEGRRNIQKTRVKSVYGNIHHRPQGLNQGRFLPVQNSFKSKTGVSRVSLDVPHFFVRSDYSSVVA